MAETLLKRQREEESHVECDENLKRHKQILSILEDEDDVANADLSDMFKTLEEQLSSGSDTNSAAADPLQGGPAAVSESCSPCSKSEYGEEEAKINVMRHLLEASDDELGLPSISGDEDSYSVENPYGFGDGLWEFEDDAANYYALLQSELFL